MDELKISTLKISVNSLDYVTNPNTKMDATKKRNQPCYFLAKIDFFVMVIFGI